MLARVVRDLSTRMGITVTITPTDQDRLLANLKGLTLAEAEKLLTRVMVEDGSLNAKDVLRVIEAKRDLVERDGLLVLPRGRVARRDRRARRPQAGLGKRRSVVDDPQRAHEFGLGFPRGVLMLGVPGAGKSPCAKAIAAEWGQPLLKPDPANFQRLHRRLGEDLPKACARADRVAPIVLWIDEMEKAFASVEWRGGRRGPAAADVRHAPCRGCRSVRPTCSRRHGERHREPARRAPPQGAL